MKRISLDWSCSDREYVKKLDEAFDADGCIEFSIEDFDDVISTLKEVKISMELEDGK